MTGSGGANDRRWIAAGWVILLAALVMAVPFGLMMALSLMFCDRPDLPCTTYAQQTLLGAAAWIVAAGYVGLSLLMQRFNWWARVVLFCLATPVLFLAARFVYEIARFFR